MQALWISATGMKAQEMRINVIANNLANINTTGFKASRADFEDLSYQTLKAAGAQGAAGTEIPTGIDLGLGVRLASVQKLFLQGDYHQTQNPLDLAIGSEGFFVVETPQGVRYTRKGTFRVDEEGYLVTSQGYRVLGKGGAIALEGAEVVVNEAGDVIVGGEVVDSLRVVSFPKGANLIREGDGLFRFEGPEGELIEVEDPRDYPKAIRVGRDGLIVEKGFFRGLLLPQVPVEWGWDERTFLSQCCLKAGLYPDAWLDKDTRIYRFQAVVFEEEAPRGPVRRVELKAEGH